MKNIMKIDYVIGSLDKFKMYKEQEQLLLDSITSCFEKIKYNYQSNNSKKINNLNNELVEKTNIIGNIHDNNVVVIERAIEKYRIAEAKSKKLFEDIEIR